MLGDEVWSRATETIAEINRSEFATSLRSRRLPKVRWVGFVGASYPVVVGFNRALIRSLAKVDHVRESRLLKGLAQQLKEEQTHNDMWRAMLEAFDIDHKSLWNHSCHYFQSFSNQALDDATQGVIQAISGSPANFSPECFPSAPFPEPVCALPHYMHSVADAPTMSFWAQFASQSAIECVIYGFASESVYPGLVDNPELDRGPRSTAWWREHSAQGGDDIRPSTEERHLQIARDILNGVCDHQPQREEIIRAVEHSLLLLSAAIRCHDLDKCGQWDATPFHVQSSPTT
jgi:hypothetical protein